MNVEVGILFVTALLTVLGYSVNDTIVVFDRIRENLIYRPRETFVETVNQSVNETMLRSINTSLTTLLVLLAVFFFGGATIKYFILALIVGTMAGTYSSIFIASPLLVTWHQWGLKRAKVSK
jgi:preprotein translocase subunit SecF